MEMNLETAIQNATGFEEQLAEAQKEMESSERHSPQWNKARRLRNEARAMLEYYQGNPNHGEIGLIKKLAGEAQRLKDQSNLGARFINRTFGNFETRRDPKAFKQCKAYSERETLFSDNRNGLLILGGVGTGKTHLAAAIANAFIQRGIPVLFGTYSEHLEHIREEFDKGDRKYLSMMKNTPILVLDDVGKEKRSEWTQQVLFDVVNYRYEHMLPIIITTNFDTDGLANHIGSAVWSRLYETCGGVVTGGKDYRIQ